MYTYERAQFRNMARPDGVLEIPAEQPLSDAEYDRLKAEWRRTYGSSRRSGKTAILEGGVTYKAISMSPRDLGHIEGRKLTREEIADGYGVPMPLLSPSGSNKAVSKTAYDQYMRDTIGPKLKLYEQKINEQLLPMFEGGENLFVAFDNPVPEDRDFALKKRDADLKSGYTSINIEREAAGEEVVDWGDVPILPANMIPLGSATPAQVQAAGQEPKEIDYERLSSEIAETILERADEG